MKIKIKKISFNPNFFKCRFLSSHASQNFNVDSWSENNGVQLDKNQNILLNTLTFPDQKIFCGLDSLKATFNALLDKTNGKAQNTLIVTDNGIFKKTEAINITKSSLETKMKKIAIYSETKENPSVYDVLNITKKYLENDCDNIIAVGGGGPMDAAKASAAMIGRIKMGNFYDLNSEEALMWTVKDLKQLLSTGQFPKEAVQNIPPLICIPTTAGTGSESGKSSVIADKNGVKYVLGHPSFMPLYVALAPQLTYSMPPSLTSSTAVDALFHCLEAYLVTDKEGFEDGLDKEGIENCDHFALEGIKLILKHLSLVLSSPQSPNSRLSLLVGASLGAKAFRKGALGAVHSTAHALGFASHIHHGTAIARMSVPVTNYNETLLKRRKEENKLTKEDEDSLKKLANLYSLFKNVGFSNNDPTHSLSNSMIDFLKSVKLSVGIKDLLPSNQTPESFIDSLTQIASNDSCQTNLIRLNSNDYKTIFENSNKTF